MAASEGSSNNRRKTLVDRSNCNNNTSEEVKMAPSFRELEAPICGRRKSASGMRCDNSINIINIVNINSELRDVRCRNEPTRAIGKSCTSFRKRPASLTDPFLHRTRLMYFSSLLLVSFLIAALVTVPLISASSPTASHLLMRRQALADEEGEETTTTLPATSTSLPVNVQPLLAEGAATTTTAPSSPTTTTQAPTSSETASEASVPGKSKIPPVNFTRVNELFDAVFENSEVVARWRHMDKQLTDGVRAILKAVFPHVVSMSTDAKVSGNCSGAILKWILNLRNLRSWAVQMLDAIGKPSAGILEGSLTMFGNYKQCLNVRAPDEDEIEIVEEFREYFRGQYCVLQMKPYLPRKTPFYSLNSTIKSLIRKSYKYYEKNVYDDLSELAMAFNFVTIRADLCVPSLCSRDDIQRVADFLGKKVDMRAKLLRCDIQPIEGESLVEQSHLLWSLIFVIILLLVVISTLTSVVLEIRQRSTKGKAHSLFTSMALGRSLSYMKNVQIDRINNSKPVFLYALRLIIVLWILLVNLTSQLDFQYLRELLSLRSLIMTWPMQLIVNSSLQYDALILLTAFTYSYQNINSNLKDLVKYNISKYSRLAPSIMFFVALTIITPLLYQNRSPVWKDFVDEPAQVCKSNGFINIFFLQNLLSYEQICLPQTWLFCVELQLCLLAIPIVYLLNKNFDLNHGQFRLCSLPVLTLIMGAAFGCLMNFRSIYQNSLPATWFQTFPDKDDKNLYFTIHLYKTWAHLTPFAVGLLAGHLCRCQSIDTFSGRPYGRKCCDNLIWFVSATTMTALIYSLHSWSLSGQSHLDFPILSALYGALAPLFWSISWSLILFHLTVPNEKNQRSSLAILLTSDVNLVRLGRLSFLAYLINPYVNMVVLAMQEQAIFSSFLMLSHTFIGNLVLTFALSFAVSALVELPCRRLIKKLALGSRRQCSNLDIIARQLNIRHQNEAPSRESFTAQQKQQLAQQPMIPLG